jgi:hypothetical protein
VSRLVAVLMVGGLLAGCAAARLPSSTRHTAIREADALVRDGQYGQAQQAYAAVLAPHDRPPDGDRALLGLARVALAPDNPRKDEQEGIGYLDRLIRDYPNSEWVAEARAWREALQTIARLRTDIERVERSARRHAQEVDRLREELRRERREVQRLRQDRERLRQLDVDLEQRPPSR